MNGSHQQPLTATAATRNTPVQGEEPGLLPGAVVQLFLFEGDRYLGWDCFAKDMVLVGGEPGDDLLLDGLAGSGTRAVVYVDGERVVVHDPSASGAVRVNDEAVATRMLGPLDAVAVGRYTLKVRVKQMGGVPLAHVAEPPSVEASPLTDPSTSQEDSHTGHTATPPEGSQTSEIGPDAGLEHPGALEQFQALVEEVTVEASVASHRVAAESAPGRVVAFEEWFDEEPGEPAEDPEPPTAVRTEAPAADTLKATEPNDAAPVTTADPQPDAAAPADQIEAAPSPGEPETTAALDAAAPVDIAELIAAAPTQATAAAHPDDPQQDSTPVQAAQPETSAEAASEPVSAAEPVAAAAPGWQMPALVHVPDDEPDEDEAEDREASFSLLDLTTSASASFAPEHGQDPADSVLQVAHSRAGQLLDLTFLHCGATYRAPGPVVRGRKQLPLLQREAAGSTHLNLHRGTWSGELLLAGGRREPLAGEPGETGDALLHVALPPGAAATLHCGVETLHLTPVPRREVADLPPATRSGVAGAALRSLAKSSLFHALVLVVGSLFVSLPTPEEAPPETHFVQLDVEQLKPPAPKPKPPAAKPAPKPAKPVTKVAKAAKPKKPLKKVKPAPPKTKPGPTDGALASKSGKGPNSAAASPNAGGGHNGNALNRNIKQTGLLGALGIPDGVQLGASQAMAAVTNLDAVRSPRAGEAALKVGGIVGSLGSDRVEVPSVGLVNTKGTTQVVASAGIGGSGSVAALERGTTGETQVRALVSADLKAPATITGGMSREEVKKVIDQHMDEISYCYETALIEDAGLMGRVAFEWKILLSGRVGAVSIQSSSIQSDPLHACIKRAIQGWQFPEPRGAEVLVSYPFVFDVVGF